MEMPKGPFCQSCGMPMEKDEHFGTNAEGAKNEEYCTYCYEKGNFTEPDITLDDMTKKVTQMMKQRNMPADTIDKVAKFIPMLKRWQS